MRQSSEVCSTETSGTKKFCKKEETVKSSIIAFLLLISNLSTAADFESQIQVARNQIKSKDFSAAASTISALRNQIRDRSSRYTDVRGLPEKVSKASTSLLLEVLNTAKTQHDASDVPSTLDSLDLARIYCTVLYHHEPPRENLARMEAKIAFEKSNSSTGEASLGTLMQASRPAYRAQDFNRTIDLANRAIKAVSENPRRDGQTANWEHNLAGLAFLAQGDQPSAVTELTASIDSQGRKLFLPSMALASALVDKQPQAVIGFLDSAAHVETWPNRDRALQWKQDVEAGRKPDFGGMPTLGLDPP